MTISHTAGLIQFIQTMTLDPAIGGIGPVPLPQDAVLPYVTVQLISAIEIESQDGPSGLIKTIMQVNCWSKDLEQASLTRQQIKDALLGGFFDSEDVHVDGPINHIMDTELYDPNRELHQCISRSLIYWSKL